MSISISNLLNFINDNFGKDNSVVGLSGLKKKTEYVFITVPKSYKNTYIQNTETNYLLI